MIVRCREVILGKGMQGGRRRFVGAVPRPIRRGGPEVWCRAWFQHCLTVYGKPQDRPNNAFMERRSVIGYMISRRLTSHLIERFPAESYGPSR